MFPYKSKVKRAILCMHLHLMAVNTGFLVHNIGYIRWKITRRSSELFVAIEQATIYLPEITLGTTARFFKVDTNTPNGKAYLDHIGKLLDHQISALGKVKIKK